MGGHEWLHNEFSIKLTFLGAIQNGLIGVYQGNNLYNSPLWTIQLEFIGSCIIFSFTSLFFKYKNINYITAFVIILMISIFKTTGIYLSLFIIGAIIVKNKIRLNKKLLIPTTIIALYIACENQWTPEVL